MVDKKNSMKNVQFSEAIRLATLDIMNKDKKVFVMGIGVNDVKGIFGTTIGLKELFGVDRVVSTPVAENAVLGMALGMAMADFKPLVIFQRADFALSAFEQIVNQISKLNYVSNNQFSVTLVMRLLVGRGWGQGATHSQSLHSMLMNVPGLTIYAPYDPQDAYEILTSALSDKKPSLILEHRWLYDSRGPLNKETPIEIGPKKLRDGKLLTIVAISEAVSMAIRLDSIFRKLGITCDVINLRTVQPLNTNLIEKSVGKTRSLCFIDISPSQFGLGAAIEHSLLPFFQDKGLKAPLLICPTFQTVPAGAVIAKKVYPQLEDVASTINEYFDLKLNNQILRNMLKESFFNDSAFNFRDTPY